MKILIKVWYDQTSIDSESDALQNVWRTATGDATARMFDYREMVFTCNELNGEELDEALVQLKAAVENSGRTVVEHEITILHPDE